jgi:hypothetical protein
MVIQRMRLPKYMANASHLVIHRHDDDFTPHLCTYTIDVAEDVGSRRVHIVQEQMKVVNHLFFVKLSRIPEIGTGFADAPHRDVCFLPEAVFSTAGEAHERRVAGIL